jgi:low temperature requirement protein LtrA
MASTALAAVLYAILTPIFPQELGPDETTHVYTAFYVIAIFETALTTAVSCYMRVISFKGTHFVQRMSLLTLIILGEGVIGATKSISSIVKNRYIFSAGVVGQIISAVLVIVSSTRLHFCNVD